jgi:hypothetical protein
MCLQPHPFAEMVLNFILIPNTNVAEASTWLLLLPFDIPFLLHLITVQL